MSVDGLARLKMCALGAQLAARLYDHALDRVNMVDLFINASPPAELTSPIATLATLESRMPWQWTIVFAFCGWMGNEFWTWVKVRRQQRRLRRGALGAMKLALERSQRVVLRAIDCCKDDPIRIQLNERFFEHILGAAPTVFVEDAELFEAIMLCDLVVISLSTDIEEINGLALEGKATTKVRARFPGKAGAMVKSISSAIALVEDRQAKLGLLGQLHRPLSDVIANRP